MTAKLHLRRLATPEEIARNAAADLAGLLLRRASVAEPFGLALSGGRIARTFYEALAVIAAQRPLLKNVHFFWADERCVPPFDPENNYRIAREHLFQPLALSEQSAVSEECIHRIRGEIDPEYAVREAEAELCRLMPMTDAGQPILDLVILGMGEDGHVASLFPAEAPEMINDARVYRRVLATKPPPARVTLGYQPLLRAREAWVLTSGPGKAEALRRLLAGDQALPIARVVELRDRTTFYHDIDLS
jgi:6-phosphogluconolactonase